MENKIYKIFLFTELTLWWKKVDNKKESNKCIVQFQVDIC